MNVLAIVVTYNGLHWVDRCFGSLRDERMQVVVIDNGSTDGTVEAIAARFPEVEIVRNTKNLGFGQANNIGLRMALERNVDHAFLLNQDAWVLPGTVERLVQAAKEDPRFGLLSPMHLNGAGDALDLNFSKFITPNRCPNLYSDLCLGRTIAAPYAARFINAAAWLVTRQCLDTVGGFSPTFFHYGEDHDYVARLHYHGLLIGVVADAWAHHDRAERKMGLYSKDRDKALSLEMLKNFTDPACDRSPIAERARMLGKALSRAARAQRAESQTAWHKFRILLRMDLGEVAASRGRSRVPGRSFL